LLATTGKVGDTVGNGVDAFGFHDYSCAECIKDELYALSVGASPVFVVKNVSFGTM
jgi:hypothetical protein